MERGRSECTLCIGGTAGRGDSLSFAEDPIERGEGTDGVRGLGRGKAKFRKSAGSVDELFLR